MSTIKFIIKYIRFLAKSFIVKLVNDGEIKFLGFVDIGPMVTIRVPGNGKLTIGNNTAILQNTFLYTSGTMSIGDNVLINRNCYIACMENIIIEDYVMMADSVSIHDNDHVLAVTENYPRIKQGFSTKPIVIHKNSWLCSKSVILKGSIIGSCSVVAAGSIVKCNIPSNWLYAGIPATAIKKIS